MKSQNKSKVFAVLFTVFVISLLLMGVGFSADIPPKESKSEYDSIEASVAGATGVGKIYINPDVLEEFKKKYPDLYNEFMPSRRSNPSPRCDADCQNALKELDELTEKISIINNIGDNSERTEQTNTKKEFSEEDLEKLKNTLNKLENSFPELNTDKIYNNLGYLPSDESGTSSECDEKCQEVIRDLDNLEQQILNSVSSDVDSTNAMANVPIERQIVEKALAEEGAVSDREPFSRSKNLNEENQKNAGENPMDLQTGVIYYNPEYEKNGYTYTIDVSMPDEIKIDDNTYYVKQITNAEIDDFGNVIEIKVYVRDNNGKAQNITLNEEQIQESEINTTVKLREDRGQQIKLYATTFRVASGLFDIAEEMFPGWKETHDDWLATVQGLTEMLDMVANPVGNVCKWIYSSQLENKEPGTKVMNTGGHSALFLDAKKQLVRTKDGEKVYYYRYSFGISPSAILEPNILSTSSSVKISVFAITDSGTIVYLNLDDDANREKEITISEPYFYSNAVYSKTKKLDKLCMRYLGSLSDLNDNGRKFLTKDFCVDFHEIESAETTVELSGEEEEIY